MVPSLSSDHARLPYLPAVDGLRGLAVVAVLLYHSDFTWARGGHLGVTTFFVLSGFLITALLLLEHDRDGHIDLGAFWARRARRLVPAALLAVALITAYLAFGTKRPDATHLGDGIASLFWVANWRFIADGASYSDLFAEPSPFRHFWSLAIEEQFYVGLVVVLVGVFALVRDRVLARWSLLVIAVLGIVTSTELASLLHDPGEGPLRAYFGTDARIAEPLVGVVLALIVVRGGGVLVLSSCGRKVLDGAAAASAVGLGVLMVTLDVWDPSLYDGGLLLAAVLASVVIAAATQAGPASRLLGGPTLAFVGQTSYGLYLFHWPIFLWLDEQATGLYGPRLLLLRVTVTGTLAVVSFFAIEQPIRLGRLPRRVGGVAWANSLVVLVAALALVSGTVSWPQPARTEEAAGVNAPTRAEPRRAPVAGPSTTARTIATPIAVPDDAQPPASPGSPTTPVATRQRAAPPTTVAPPVLYRVAFVGDSIAWNLATGMEAWGRDNGIAVLDLSRHACPLARGGQRRFREGWPWAIPEACDWWADPASDSWDKLRAFEPEVIVAGDALNEMVDRKLDDWPKYMRPGEPMFDAWLTAEYRELVDAIADENIGMLLLNAPCADWKRHEAWGAMPDQDGRVTALNTIVYREIGTSATRVLDLFEYLCPKGQYSDYVDGEPNARPDGFHLSSEAAQRAAERFLAPAVLEVANHRDSAGR